MPKASLVTPEDAALQRERTLREHIDGLNKQYLKTQKEQEAHREALFTAERKFEDAEKALSNAKARKKSLEGHQIQSETSSELKIANNRVNELQVQMQKIERKIAAKEKHIHDKDNRISHLQDTQKNRQGYVIEKNQKLSDEIQKYENARSQAKTQKETYAEKAKIRDSAEKSLRKLTNLKRNFEKKAKNANYNAEKYKKKSDQVNSEIVRLNEKCATFVEKSSSDNHIDNDFINVNTFKGKLLKLQNQYNEKRIKYLNSRKESYKKKIEEYQQVYSEFSKKAEGKNAPIDTANNEYQEALGNAYKEKLAYNNCQKSANNQFKLCKTLKSTISRAKKKVNSVFESIQKVEDRRLTLKSELSELEIQKLQIQTNLDDAKAKAGMLKAEYSGLDINGKEQQYNQAKKELVGLNVKTVQINRELRRISSELESSEIKHHTLVENRYTRAKKNVLPTKTLASAKNKDIDARSSKIKNIGENHYVADISKSDNVGELTSTEAAGADLIDYLISIRTADQKISITGKAGKEAMLARAVAHGLKKEDIVIPNKSSNEIKTMIDGLDKNLVQRVADDLKAQKVHSASLN